MEPRKPQTFRIPRTNVIESDSGFSVEVLGRTGLEYVEGERKVRIDAEFALGQTGLIVFTRWLTEWHAPVAGEPIDEATRERIAENLRAAFRFRGFAIDTI